MTQTLATAMATSAVAEGGFHGKYRMRPRGKWFIVTDTKNVPVLYPTAQVATDAADATGRAYRQCD